MNRSLYKDNNGVTVGNYMPQLPIRTPERATFLGESPWAELCKCSLVYQCPRISATFRLCVHFGVFCKIVGVCGPWWWRGLCGGGRSGVAGVNKTEIAARRNILRKYPSAIYSYIIKYTHYIYLYMFQRSVERALTHHHQSVQNPAFTRTKRSRS